MATREDLAWAAGVWDGEGCTDASSYIMKSGRRQRSLKAVLVQKDRRLLERFQRVVGFGKIYPRRLSQHPRPDGYARDDQWGWQVAKRDDVMALCWLLWTWLDVVKREQFEDEFRTYRNFRTEGE